MPILKKLFLIFFLSLILFVLTDNFIVARELEITYPTINNISGPSSTRALLPDYVKYIFNFAIAISSLVVFGVMVYAGFLYVTSAGNPTTMKDATDRITSAIIGLIIILSSYLLLTTINPQLTVINPILGTNEGVIVYDTEANCKLGKGSPESQEKLEPDVNYLKLGVSSANLEKLNGHAGAVYLYKGSDELKVYLYENENWSGIKQEITGTAGSCITSPLSTAKSIELAWQNPGVYLCKDATSKECSVYSSSQTKLANGFNDKVQYIKFKNPYAYDSSIPASDCTPDKGRTYFTDDNQGKKLEKPTCGYKTQKYGAILHEGQDYTETCEAFFNNATTSPANNPSPKIDNIFPSDGVSSITVFLQPQPGETPEGKGVTLYEDIDYQGDQKTILPTTPNLNDFSKINWDNKAENMRDKVSSIKIDGNYMALLFHNKNFEGRCEAFRDNDPNLNKKTGNHIDEDQAESAKVIIIKK